jgi:cytochrome c-type biogenesis protein CcmH/NrfG
LAAARHAIALKPAAVEPRLALAQLQLGEADDKALPADFLATLREVLAIDPANSTALYYLGTAAAVRGDKAEARRFWEKLLSVIPQDQPERAEIASRLASLAR